MAKSAFRRHRLQGVTLTTVSSLAWLLGVCPAGAVDDQTSESLRNTEAGQEQIRTQAQELVSQLQGMSAEFKRNGLKGDEVKVLDLLSASISTMSEQEMTRIIGLLRQARTAGNQGSVLQQVAAAYTWQKSLTVQMNGLLSTYQKDQAAANVAAALTKLAERQTANLQTGITVAQWNTGKKADDSQSELKATLEVQSSEQAALRDEAKQAAARLETAARGATDPAAAAKAQAALQKLNQLNAALDQATNDLKDGHIFKALTNEKQARDGMRQLARELTPLRETPADALRQTEKDMANMIAQQKEMLTETDKVKNAPSDVAKWVQQELTNPKSWVSRTVADEKNGLVGQTPEQLAEDKKIKGIFQAGVTTPNNQKLAALESRSNELVDRGDQMSQDLQKDAAPVAAAVKTAQEKMQAARADLDDHNAASALANQQAALAQMEQAQKQVQAQIAAQDAAQNADRMAQLQTARAQAQSLAAQQNTAAQQHAAQPQAGAGNAAQEADLKNKAQALQEKAATAQAPAAAAAIQQAVAQMQNAASALKSPAGQAQAQAAEAAAATALQAATTQLDKDIAQTAAAQQQLQKVDQALASLERIITGQEKVQTDTALASAVSVPPAKSEKSDQRAAKVPAAKIPGDAEIAAQQADLKTNTAALVQTLTTADVQPAVDPLNSAQSQMESSHGALARSNPAGARDPQRFVLTDLLQAKQVLNSKKSQLAQLTNPAAAQAAQEQQNAQLATQIAQAQAQAQAAQAQLAQAQQQQPGQQQQTAQQSSQQQSAQQQGKPQTAQMQNVQQALDNAANLTGQAAANNASGPQPGALQQALTAARQALNQAASAATSGDQATAQAQTDRAQQALTQAQSQVQAAQSGLAQADQNGAVPAGGTPAAGQPGRPAGSQPGTQPSGQSQKGPGQPGGPRQAANGAQQPGQSSQDGQASPGASDDPRDPGKIGNGSLEKGAGGSTRQGSAFAALPARDRAALQQSQAEKYPQEYGAMIEQYMQSLADQPGN